MTITKYKGYTIEVVGLSHHIWRDLVSARFPITQPGESGMRPRGPHGYEQSMAAAKRWINSDKGTSK